jgi:hypothetical protein
MKIVIQVALLAFAAGLGQSTLLASDPLNEAKTLAAGRFNGWSYGSRQSEKQIDCVQFVMAVTEECLAQSLGTASRPLCQAR